MNLTHTTVYRKVCYACIPSPREECLTCGVFRPQTCERCGAEYYGGCAVVLDGDDPEPKDAA